LIGEERNRIKTKRFKRNIKWSNVINDEWSVKMIGNNDDDDWQIRVLNVEISSLWIGIYNECKEKSSDEVIICSLRRYSTGRRRSHCFFMNGITLESNWSQPIDEDWSDDGEDLVEVNTRINYTLTKWL